MVLITYVGVRWVVHGIVSTTRDKEISGVKRHVSRHRVERLRPLRIAFGKLDHLVGAGVILVARNHGTPLMSVGSK
jgi:hypothetical protein